MFCAARPALSTITTTTSNSSSSSTLRQPYHSRRPAVATAAGSSDPHASTQQQQQQPQQQQHFSPLGCADGSSSSIDPGLESFKALVGSKRFTCTQCGKCCTGDGEVWVSDAEAAAIARHLNLSLQRFFAAHTRAYSRVAGFHMLRANQDSEARECTFLRPDNSCAIHPVRPLQCSTYPWWPELMNDQEWAWERENICEGFDHADAPPTDLADAAQQLKLATAQEYQKMLATKPSKKKQKQQQQQQQQPAGPAASSSGLAPGPPPLQQQPPTATASDRAATAAVAWQLRLQSLQDQLYPAEGAGGLSDDSNYNPKPLDSC